MVSRGQDATDLMVRAREACDKAAAVSGAFRITLEQTRSLKRVSAAEALAHSRLAELNELVENLNKRLESQPTIEQAKGILMARSHCSPDEAFEMLRRASMRMNRKLRDVARDIVESTSEAAAHHG
jgi:AmiR/NasT family two-component response regulator